MLIGKLISRTLKVFQDNYGHFVREVIFYFFTSSLIS